jgi:hypothetical protein
MSKLQTTHHLDLVGRNSGLLSAEGCHKIVDSFLETWLEGRTSGSTRWSTSSCSRRSRNGLRGWVPVVNCLGGRRPPQAMLPWGYHLRPKVLNLWSVETTFLARPGWDWSPNPEPRMDMTYNLIFVHELVSKNLVWQKQSAAAILPYGVRTKNLRVQQATLASVCADVVML